MNDGREDVMTATRPVDWLREEGPMAGRIRAHDWSATPLGPIESWPHALRTAVGMVLGSGFPSCIVWGPHLVTIYNDAFRPILGTKPEALGRPFSEVWSEAWQALDPIAKDAFAGKATFIEDFPLTIERSGFPEQAFFTFCYSPIRDEHGNVAGMLDTVIETTGKVLVERRQAFLLSLDEQLRGRTDPSEATLAAATALGRHAGAARAGYGEIDPAGETIRVERDWTDGSVASLAGEARLLDGFGPAIIAELRAGRTLVVEDCLADPRSVGDAHAANWASIGVRALVVVPLLKAGRLTATLFLHAPEPRRWSEMIVGLAEDTARRTWEAVERARAELALQASEAELRLVTDALPMLIAFVDRDLVYRFFNRACEEWLGRAPEELLGRAAPEVLGQSAYALRERAMKRALAGEPAILEFPWPHRDGRRRDAEIRYIPRRNAQGEVDGFHVFVLDVTARKLVAETLHDAASMLEARVRERTAALEEEMAGRLKLEAALRQSQKMEAVGQLTGGIAHDFNNMLTGIIGSMDVLRRRIAAGRLGDVDRFMDAALASANRAASLTHRLLAFSRRQSLDPQPLDVNRLLGCMVDLIRRSINERIILDMALGEDLPWAVADSNQLENAILNLAINARDAMPEGGRLTIETARVQLDATDAAARPGLEAGAYLMVAVSDTGVGIAPEVLDKVYEPFFTTKPIGQGTGLGLSMVYGFAQQSNGQVRIHSQPGQGTSVKIYLPLAGTVAAADEPEAPVAAGPAGLGQTILLVEDDASVRLLVTDALQDLGYTVIETSGPRAAIYVLASARPIVLMVSDVGLPDMNGRQLAEIARQHRRDLPILFITGYAENAAIRSGFLGTGMAMIMKPFSLDVLAARVGEMLDGSAG